MNARETTLQFRMLNSFVTNGFSDPYHLESTFILRGVRSIFIFHFIFYENHVANRIAPDGSPRFAEFHLGLFCLPISHKKDTRLIWVKYSRSTDQHKAKIGSN